MKIVAAITNHMTIQGKGVPNMASDPGNGEKIAPTNGLIMGAMASLIFSSIDLTSSCAKTAAEVISPNKVIKK